MKTYTIAYPLVISMEKVLYNIGGTQYFIVPKMEIFLQFCPPKVKTCKSAKDIPLFSWYLALWTCIILESFLSDKIKKTTSTVDVLSDFVNLYCIVPKSVFHQNGP